MKVFDPDLSASDLVKLAIRHALWSGKLDDPLWAEVKRMFCVGSTTARKICETYGFDPDMTRRSERHQERREELVSALNEHETQAGVARAMGVSRQYVHQLVKKFGLEKEWK